MKKILVMLMVLGMASVASATIIIDTPVKEVVPSEIIRIALHSVDEGVIGINGAYLQEPPAQDGYGQNPGAVQWDTAGYEGYPVNDGTTLIAYLSGSQTGTPPNAYLGDISWFDYHVPYLPESTYITIWFDGIVTGYDPATGGYDAQVEPLILHIIPEPMTIGLLGLGGLALLRRRR
jgi:hypothetical protein